MDYHFQMFHKQASKEADTSVKYGWKINSVASVLDPSEMDLCSKCATVLQGFPKRFIREEPQKPRI